MRAARFNLEARVLMSRVMRAFAGGQLTNRQFEELSESLVMLDDAVSDAYCFAWPQYCDIRTHRMQGEWRLDPERRRLWARWILLLRTDLPAHRSGSSDLIRFCFGVCLLASLLLSLLAGLWTLSGLCALGMLGLVMLPLMCRTKRGEANPSSEDPSPFVTSQDEAAARARSVFLCGAASPAF